VRPFLARAGLMVVPLRIGGGSRLKILEALAAGVPVVSTRVGAEGLHLGERHFHQVEDIADLTPAILKAARSPREARERAEAGRRQVLRLYDWGELARRLVALWERVVREPGTAPAARGGAA
jgi:glycosyltransferase involved in cell wall biosynthesis